VKCSGVVSGNNSNNDNKNNNKMQSQSQIPQKLNLFPPVPKLLKEFFK
jgi:hypothetical protein